MEQEVNFPVRKNIQSHSILLAPNPHDICQCFDFLYTNKSHSLFCLHVFLRFFFSPFTFPVLQDDILVYFTQNKYNMDKIVHIFFDQTWKSGQFTGTTYATYSFVSLSRFILWLKH